MLNLTAVSNNAGSGQLGLGACGLPNLASHSWKQVSFRRKTTPYRADRQNDIFIYWRVHTTYLLPSTVGFAMIVPFQE